MFALKYINRHLFMEHAGRLYLVDTGCPKSFAINHELPWVNMRPHSVIVDMMHGRLRFTWGRDGDHRKGTAHPFTKSPGTRAPMFRCHPDSKMIWDTGAQIGYVDMRKVPLKNIVQETGPFVDFSPIYGSIESPMTWLVRFDFLPTIDMEQRERASHIHCRMAGAPQRIINDIRREGADGVLGNDWMARDEGVVMTIEGQNNLAHIQGLPFDAPKNPADVRTPATRDPINEGAPDPENMPSLEMRYVPSSLGAFTTEGLRRHIELDNIDGLIGNDLLLDTVL